MMRFAVLIGLLVVMAGLAFAQAPPIVTPEPTTLPTSFSTAVHPFTPSPTPTPAPKLEPPGMKK